MSFFYLAPALIVVGALAYLVNARVTVAGRLRDTTNVVLALIVVGILLWTIDNYVPMAGSIKAILNIVVVAETCVGVLHALGLWKRTLRLWSSVTHHRTAR
jgi:predicted membrane protein